MKLGSINKAGYFKIIGDNEINTLYEVYENSDKAWLEEEPAEKYLLEEWTYDYSDEDDRKVYSSNGTCIGILNLDVLLADTDVEEIGDKYVWENDCLREDKPTYKERYFAAKKVIDSIGVSIAGYYIEGRENA